MTIKLIVTNSILLLLVILINDVQFIIYAYFLK